MSTAYEMQFRNDFLPQWERLFDVIFPMAVPAHAEWHDLQQMITVLSLVGSTPSLNHMFFPDTGGDDLTAVVAAKEDRLLELHCGENIRIVSPIALTCETFSGNSEWSYFRLETDNLKPSGVYGNSSETESEELVELSTGEYLSRDGWDDDHMCGDDIPFPPSARLLSRELSGGAFVLFCKASRYNLENAYQAYDAVHNEMSRLEFRNYIASFANRTRSATM